jgi:hypothetical protein
MYNKKKALTLVWGDKSAVQEGTLIILVKGGALAGVDRNTLKSAFVSQ